MQQPSAPLLDNAAQPVAQGQYIQPTGQDPYASGNMYGTGSQAPAPASAPTATGYNQGTMYNAPSNTIPSGPVAPADTSGVAAAANGTYTPNEQQLGEGIAFEPIIVAQQEPVQVEGGKDGVGMAEGCARNPHVLSWILTLLIWFMIASLAACQFVGGDGFCEFFAGNIGTAAGITGAVAVAYWIECACSGSGKYLSNILQNEGAAQFVERIKRQPAVIRWTVRCYHWETRRRRKTVTDSNGNKRTEWETHREKVYTWSATEQYTYATCIDVSGQLVGLDQYNLTKLRLHKTYGFADEDTRRDFVARRRMFRMMNWRDMHQEFHEDFSVDGFVDRILAESEPGIKPWWMSNSYYWLFNVLFLSPVFRHKMSAACGNAEYRFYKQISIH